MYVCIYTFSHCVTPVLLDSFDDLVESIGHSATETLTDLVITQVFDKLGLTPYLQDEPCSLSDPIYSGDQNGWTKGIFP